MSKIQARDVSSRQVYLRGATERWARDRAAQSRAASACEERQRGLVDACVDGPLVAEVRYLDSESHTQRVFF